MRSARPLLLVLAAAGCSTVQGDPPAPYMPNPLGNGLRLAQVQDPGSPDHHACGSNVTGCQSVTVSSLAVTWLDTFDETKDGKSVGTLYIQDVGDPHPFGGIGCYETTYVPGDFRPNPGDVLDFTGPYQEAANVGAATFDPGTFLAQLYKPVATARYEYQAPPPVTLTTNDLNENNPATDGNFTHARQYLQMLVTVKDVTVGAGGANGLRVAYPVLDANMQAIPNGVSISNELYDLKMDAFPAGTHFKSVTGIVTWFFTFHIAPRFPSDLVQ
jgi:hypothetical protein